VIRITNILLSFPLSFVPGLAFSSFTSSLRSILTLSILTLSILTLTLMHFLCYLSVGGGFWSAQKIAELRAQSGFALGSGQHVHCNAAGASPSPDPVLRGEKLNGEGVKACLLSSPVLLLIPSIIPSLVAVLTSHLNSEAAVGGYAAASFAASSLDSTYLSIESLVNAPPSSVALHDSSTTSFTHGIHSIPLSSESVIVSCSSAEYASNAIAIMKHSRDKGGLEPIFLTNVVGGGVDMEALEREVRLGEE